MDNIRLGNKNATDDEVIEAAKLANCRLYGVGRFNRIGY